MEKEMHAFRKWLAHLIEEQAQIKQNEMTLAVGYHHRSSVNKVLRGRRQLKPEFWVNALIYLRSLCRVPEHPAEVMEGLALLGLSPAAVIATIERTELTAATKMVLRKRMQDEGQRPSPDRKTWFLEWLQEWNQPHVNPQEQGIRLPRWHVQRPLCHAQVQSLLLARDPARRRWAVLWGTGGIGKTTLAQTAALDDAVQRHYYNGLLWATLGPGGDAQHWLREWCRRLGLPLQGDETVWALHERVKEAVNAPWRRFLIVLDDVWQAQDAEPLLVGGPHSGTLLTTREQHVVQKLGLEAALIQVGEMAEDEAKTLIRRRLGRRLGRRYRPAETGYHHRLIELVGGLPLALELGGAAAISRGWRYVLAALADESRAVQVLSLRKPEHRQHNLAWTLSLSYEGLSPQAQRLFERLGTIEPGKPFTGAEAVFFGRNGPRLGRSTGVGGSQSGAEAGKFPLSDVSHSEPVRRTQSLPPSRRSGSKQGTVRHRRCPRHL